MIFKCPTEIALLIADFLHPNDIFNLQQSCQWLREALRLKTWQRLDIFTTMEDETIGETMIGRQGQLQVGNKNVELFLKALNDGHLDEILPFVKYLYLSEESPFVVKNEYLNGNTMFGNLFKILLNRKLLPRVNKISLQRELSESVAEEETALNTILKTEFPTANLDFVLYPSYGLKWFSNDDKYLFNKLTNIQCYTSSVDLNDQSVLTFDFALPKSLETFSIQNPDISIDTREFKTLFANCTNLHTLDLDISQVVYSESINWIPESVSDLFIHVNREIAPSSEHVKKITSKSVERLALVGNFWNVLPTLRVPNLRDLDLSVEVTEEGIPKDRFNKSVANVIKDSCLDSITVNFSIEGLPLMVPEGTAATVTRVRVANNWRSNYDFTSHNTSQWAMKDALKRFPKLNTLEVALSGLRTDTKLPYLLHMTKVSVAASKEKLMVRFFAIDLDKLYDCNDLFACNTMFSNPAKNVLEFDRSRIRAVYDFESLKKFRQTVRSKYMKDYCDIIEMVLEGR